MKREPNEARGAYVIGGNGRAAWADRGTSCDGAYGHSTASSLERGGDVLIARGHRDEPTSISTMAASLSRSGRTGASTSVHLA